MCHPDTDVTAAAPGTGVEREGTFTIESAGTQLPVFHASPAGVSRGNVVIIHDIFGANDFYHDLARRLAADGFTAYLPDLFVRHGPLPTQTFDAARARGARLSFPGAIDDLTRVFDAVTARSSLAAGAVGFCMGGTLVMLLASREPRLSAGVIYYGFPRNANPSDLRPYDPIGEAAEMRAPLLGFWGDQDHGVGMDNVETYRAALSAAEKEHAFTIYPGLPHGFLTFDLTSPHQEGSQDSYRRMLAFFGERLGA